MGQTARRPPVGPCAQPRSFTGRYPHSFEKNKQTKTTCIMYHVNIPSFVTISLSVTMDFGSENFLSASTKTISSRSTNSPNSFWHFIISNSCNKSALSIAKTEALSFYQHFSISWATLHCSFCNRPRRRVGGAPCNEANN